MQQDISQQIHLSILTEYVMGFGGMSKEKAEAWLDKECPRWREGKPPSANKIEVEDSEDDS